MGLISQLMGQGVQLILSNLLIELGPWILYALSLCLAGAAVLVIGLITYRMLRIPRTADSKGEA